MQYSYFSVISGFLYKTEDPFRDCSCSSPEISLLVLKIFQHSKRNFVSPRGHVISSIVTCDQAIFFLAGEKNNISPAKKKKSPDRRLPLLKRACFGSWLTERGILLLRRACFPSGLQNEEYYISSALTDPKIGGYNSNRGEITWRRIARLPCTHRMNTMGED